MTISMESLEHVTLEIKDQIATVTFNRPPVNALDAQSFRELAAVFNHLARTRDASVAILTAPGEKLFCAGVDLKDSARRHARELIDSDTTMDLLDTGVIVRECFWAILDCPLPVIAAVNGRAIGAGLVLVANCDIIIASEKASFSVPEIKAGLLGAGRHLQRLVGPYKARKMFFTGEAVSAQEFYRLGAVEEVVAPDQLMPAALKLAGEIAAHSPIGLRLGKESLNRVEFLPLKEGYRLEQDYTGRGGQFKDAKEAGNAYREKRPPNWSWS